MARLILIRHGQTDYNLEKRYCGFSDPPLNAQGIWQAEKLADRLNGLKIDKVYSSDLKRARQTAEIVFRDILIEKSTDFREMNFGIFEGLGYEMIIKEYPHLYSEWINSPAKIKIPGGEGLIDLKRRVLEKLASILSVHVDDTIAIVSHAGPIRVILCNGLGYGLKIFWQIEQEPCALNIIDYSEARSPIVVARNDTAHLFVKEALRP